MTQPFSPEQALAQAGGSEELLCELIDIFRKECPALLEEIRSAIEQDRPTKLQRAAHTLKGSAQVLGGAGVSESAWRLEQMGQAGNCAEAAQTCDNLQREVEQLMDALDAWRKQAQQL